ncbi:EAL domain-containing protein [Acinetobacter sp. WZC-1]|uniref:EAL domain-containing protein n=1 Tax=Acinetobacter sp. WZC-1 TaxID=3459034 RepID=UPI00403D77FC
MGSLEVRNLLLSRKLKLSETRLLVIDDNQIRYNKILEIFQTQKHLVQATLLDDLASFEKQLNICWDIIIFGQAYDLKIEQAITLIQASSQIDIPVLLLRPEDYQAEQYPRYIHKGVYDVVDPAAAESFYAGLIRALSYSRLLQAQFHLLNDLDYAKNQAQALVHEQNKAIATLQEGIHTQANAEYLKLFGLSSEEEIIGLPILDILQPNDVNDFKTRFKKISQGQFEFSRFEMDSQNVQAGFKNPLKIEFLPSAEDDTIQITIETPSTTPDPTPGKNHATHTDESPYQKIHRGLMQQPARANALVLFSLASCPDEILHLNWDTSKAYFYHLRDFIQAQTSHLPFRLDTALYAVLLQAESVSSLESRISGLAALEKPQLLTVHARTFPLQLKLGYSLFDTHSFTEAGFEQILAQAYNTPLPKRETASDRQLEATLQETRIELLPDQQIQATMSQQNAPEPILNTEPVIHESPVLLQIQQKLKKGEIHLKYQQLYDKKDTELYSYEVTSGFIYENQWKKTCGLVELDEDVELSIQLDRWILVEACKQLHNFISQYPEAKLIVNLNRHILFKDKQFPELVSKLITIVGSRLSHPLILQFDEEDIARNLAESQKQLALIRTHGAEIALRNFGSTISSDAILRQIDISYLALDEKYTQMLHQETAIPQLQELVESYHAIRPVELLLRNLNDMNSFANAWNVDARFLTGEYFQKKLDHLTDVQDQ